MAIPKRPKDGPAPVWSAFHQRWGVGCVLDWFLTVRLYGVFFVSTTMRVSRRTHACVPVGSGVSCAGFGRRRGRSACPSRGPARRLWTGLDFPRSEIPRPHHTPLMPLPKGRGDDQTGRPIWPARVIGGSVLISRLRDGQSGQSALTSFSSTLDLLHVAFSSDVPVQESVSEPGSPTGLTS